MLGWFRALMPRRRGFDHSDPPHRRPRGGQAVVSPRFTTPVALNDPLKPATLFVHGLVAWHRRFAPSRQRFRHGGSGIQRHARQ
jgi:hypothetical protein